MTGQRVVPTLRITDEARSRAFYVDGLGFKVDWEHRFERLRVCTRQAPPAPERSPAPRGM